MTKQEDNSRLAHFLKGYPDTTPELESVIYDRMHRAGLSPNDPTSWLIAHNTITETKMLEHGKQIDSLPPRIAKKLMDSFDQVENKHVQALAAEKSAIAKRVADEAGAALREGMPRLVRQFHWRVALHLIATFMVATVLATGVGYVSGRAETSTLAAQQAALAARPDASTWIRLQTANGNIDDIIVKHCLRGQQHFVETGTERGACNVPLNLDGQAVPAPAGIAGQVEEQLVSTRAKMSFVAILFLGGLIGVGFLYLGRFIYDIIFDR